MSESLALSVSIVTVLAQNRRRELLFVYGRHLARAVLDGLRASRPLARTNSQQAVALVEGVRARERETGSPP